MHATVVSVLQTPVVLYTMSTRVSPELIDLQQQAVQRRCFCPCVSSRAEVLGEYVVAPSAENYFFAEAKAFHVTAVSVCIVCFFAALQ